MAASECSEEDSGVGECRQQSECVHSGIVRISLALPPSFPAGRARAAERRNLGREDRRKEGKDARQGSLSPSVRLLMGVSTWKGEHGARNYTEQYWN